MLKWARRKHLRPTGSRVCEDAGNRARRAQELAKTDQLSVQSMWRTLVEKKVLSDVYDYEEISGENQRLLRKARAPQHFFHAAAHLANHLSRDFQVQTVG